MDVCHMTFENAALIVMDIVFNKNALAIWMTLLAEV